MKNMSKSQDIYHKKLKFLKKFHHLSANDTQTDTHRQDKIKLDFIHVQKIERKQK